jgi:uncharacterized phage-associated protein
MLMIGVTVKHQDSQANDRVADFECKKITQALNYLVRKTNSKSIDKTSLVKLLWAADRYHLRKYGRTVTEGKYVAMKNGPVLSIAKDILKRETAFGLSEDCVPYIDDYIRTSDDDVVSSVKGTDMGYLSKTDVNALNFSWTKLGALSSNAHDIIEFAHKYPEWLSYEEELKSSFVKDIDMEMFFQDTTLVESDPFILDEENKEYSHNKFKELEDIKAILRK